MKPSHSGSVILLLAFASVPFAPLAQSPHKQSHYVEVGHVTIRLAESTQPLRLSFQTTSIDREFTRIRFRSADNTYILHSAYTLRRLNTPGDPRADTPDFNISNLRFDPSRYFRTGHYTDANGDHTLLFFMGEAVASDACSLLVIGFDTKGQPYKVLEKETLEITVFLPPIDGKPALIVGKPTLSQEMRNPNKSRSAPYATTYDPFAVYVLPVTPGKAAYSLDESRLYNQQHYVWAGPHSSERTLVYYNIPHHSAPFTAPAENLDKIIE
jgi:hypothetical protein